MKVLFLSRWLPYPPDNGSKQRAFHLLTRLAAHGHDIHLITYAAPDEDQQVAREKLSAYCSQIEIFEYSAFQPHSWRSRMAFFALKPRSVVTTFQPALAQSVERSLATGEYDLVLTYEVDMAAYGAIAARYNVPALLEELEVGVLYEQWHKAEGVLHRLRYGLTWLKVALYVRQLARKYQAISVVSKREQAIITPLTGRTPVHVLPNGADTRAYHFHPYTTPERANRLVFNGALTFAPNNQAMRYFVSEIFPLVRQRDPLMSVAITGRYTGVDVSHFYKPGVILTGYVQDMQLLLSESAACIVPLLQGGGTRLKVLEAFALGTPVISTSKGAEGLGAQSGRHLLIADTPEDFAAAILRIKNEAGLAAYLATNARALVEEYFDWDVITAQLEQIMDAVTTQKRELVH